MNHTNAAILGLLTTVFTVSFAFTAYLTYVCTVAVPTDVLVSKQRELRNKGEIFDNVWEDTGEVMELFCNICQAYVQEGTKHCGPCNRCCEEFDHHCKWLNNCVGLHNYVNFRRLINAYLVFCLAFVLLFVQALANSLISEDGVGSVAAIVLISFQTLVNCIAFLVDGQLIYFHIWLTRKGYTTFQYVIYQRELKEKLYSLKVSLESSCP